MRDDTATEDAAGARRTLVALAEVGIDLAALTDQLERDGVAQFAAAWDKLLGETARKVAAVGAAPRAAAEPNARRVTSTEGAKGGRDGTGRTAR